MYISDARAKVVLKPRARRRLNGLDDFEMVPEDIRGNLSLLLLVLLIYYCCYYYNY